MLCFIEVIRPGFRCKSSLGGFFDWWVLFDEQCWSVRKTPKVRDLSAWTKLCRSWNMISQQLSNLSNSYQETNLQIQERCSSLCKKSQKVSSLNSFSNIFCWWLIMFCSDNLLIAWNLCHWQVLECWVIVNELLISKCWVSFINKLLSFECSSISQWSHCSSSSQWGPLAFSWLMFFTLNIWHCLCDVHRATVHLENQSLMQVHRWCTLMMMAIMNVL